MTWMRKTWFVDFDGTLVYQKSHMSDEDVILPGTIDFFEKVVKKDDFVIITTGREGKEHKERISKFLEKHKIRFDMIICDLPTGPRVVVNDKKPTGTLTAYSFNLERDKGIEVKDFKF